ncbi:MAG: hypothetical protein SGARI_004812, partial [Bacillariaceae sp.]
EEAELENKKQDDSFGTTGGTTGGTTVIEEGLGKFIRDKTDEIYELFFAAKDDPQLKKWFGLDMEEDTIVLMEPTTFKKLDDDKLDSAGKIVVALFKHLWELQEASEAKKEE